MIKLLDFAPYDHNGEPTVRILSNNSINIKTASDCAWAPEIKEFIASLKPVVGKLYALINAMGATEFYSCNRNGDGFYEDALKKYYHTFENAHPFMHHINKDPEKAYGKVIKAAYNDLMHRLELVIEYDTKKLDPKFVQKIDNGEMVNVSMGCRVDSDFCSICNNRAKTPAEYCEHLTDSPGLGKMLPDGRKAFAINRDPEFFDISIVTVPADPTARVLTKIAGYKGGSSVERAEEVGLSKLATGSEVKIDMSDKYSPDVIATGVRRLFDEFDSAMGGCLPSSILDMIGGLSNNPIDILNGFIKKQVYLRPNEVQRIILVSSGKRDIADKLDSTKQIIMLPPGDMGKHFANAGCDCRGADVVQEVTEGYREFAPENIKRIIIRMTIPVSGEKLGGVVPVDFSDDFKYLLNRDQVEQVGLSFASPIEALKTFTVLGALVSAFSDVFKIKMGPNILQHIAVISQLNRDNKVLSPLKHIGEMVNRPVQEMTFMNNDSPEVVRAALINALNTVNANEGKFAGIANPYHKLLLAAPISYGLSALTAHEARKNDLFNAQYTGRYEPSMLSRPELTLPVAFGLLMKYGAAKERAEQYVKQASRVLGRDAVLRDSSYIDSCKRILFK